MQYTPEVKTWGCCKVSGPREYQKSDDSICVFLNYVKLGEFKDRKLAEKLIRKLLEEAPESLDEFKDYVLK